MTTASHQLKADTELFHLKLESEKLDKELKSYDQIAKQIHKLEMAIGNVHKNENSNLKILKILQFMLDKKRIELASISL